MLNAQVCDLALSPRFRPDICMCNICCLEKAQSYFHQECTQGSDHRLGSVGLSLTGSWDCLYTSLGGGVICRWGDLSGFGKALNGGCDVASRNHVPLIQMFHSEYWLLFPSFSLPPSRTAHDSVLWKGKREMGPFGSIPHGWGSQVLIPMLSCSLVEEITSQQKLSFTEMCHPGGGVDQNIPFTISNVSHLGYLFYSCGMLELIHWTPRFVVYCLN